MSEQLDDNINKKDCNIGLKRAKFDGYLFKVK